MHIPEAALVAHMMLKVRKHPEDWPDPPWWWRTGVRLVRRLVALIRSAWVFYAVRRGDSAASRSG